MRILVVEDEEEIGAFVKTGLEADCFTVDLVHDGERGSYLARTNDYDLLILDNLLPLKDGSVICEEVRAIGKCMPIIMLSVQGDLAQKISILNLGADDYMTKPFSLQELLARVRAVLRRPHVVQGELLRIDTLELDTARHLASRAGKRVYLTKKEFQLLEYLLRNDGRVLTRAMIMEHVWDINADPFSNTIETHILNVRRKIDRAHRVKLIHTVPGRGYKIDMQK